MFGLGGGEIVIVLLLAVIILGPKEIPRVATQLGKLFRQLKFAADDLKSTVEKELKDEPSPSEKPKDP
ncbi:MAG: twin-arginine translocase TatA/TatE family subunit [Deltaproteobacteria bacterium]|nr:twin-arginine translocase TatA/TatE family subunit [Deltaproteobacteria bacterium]